MDSATLLSKLNNAVPGSVIEVKRFGKTDILMPIVELRQVAKLSAAIKKDPALALTWLENLSVAQPGESEAALVFSYFLGSNDGSFKMVLRGVLKFSGPDAPVDCPSVQGVWPTAEPMEREAAELFGIRFVPESGDPVEPAESAPGKLPAGWNGFPLRKSYRFPEQVGAIRHERHTEEAKA